MCIVLAVPIGLAGTDGGPCLEIVGSQILVPFASESPVHGGQCLGEKVPGVRPYKRGGFLYPCPAGTGSCVHRRNKRCQRNRQVRMTGENLKEKGPGRKKEREPI